MKKIFSITFLILSVACLAQDKRGTIKVKKVESDTKSDQAVIARSVDQMPFLTNMYQFIETNIKYPDKEKKEGIQGTVYVAFVVEIDGSLSNVRVVKGVQNGSGCDKEALRIVKMMPKWTPGKNKGQAVAVECNLPIKFQL